MKSKQIISKQLASVLISFDGVSYTANLGRSSMSGEGWSYFLQSHADKVMEIKANLFVLHVAKYGWNEQVRPEEIGLETI